MKATITLGDGFISVNPFPESLTGKLHYWRRELGWNQKTHRREMKARCEDLYRIESSAAPDGSMQRVLITMPGFAARCRDYVQSCGYEVEMVDARTPMPQPDIAKAMTGLRDYQMDLVYKMLVSGGGILSAATGAGKTHVMKALVNAYSHETLKLRGTPTVVVAVPDKDITQKNFEDLTELLPDREVGLVMSGKNKFSEDVQVITLDSLHRLNADDVGVLIVDEVHTAASDTRASELLRFTKARRWGVSATPDGRFDGKDMVNEGIFGPVVANFTFQDGVKAGALVPITVYWLDAPEPNIGIESYLKYKTRDKKYMWGVHKNMALNRMIGRILKGIPQDMQTLGMLQFTKHMDMVLHGCTLEKVDPLPTQVHAGTDADEFKFPKYQYVHAISPKERKALYQEVKSGAVRQVISTHVYKQGVNFPDLRVVVNIGGGGSEIVAKQVPGRASRKIDGKDTACIIEFWHPWDTQERNGRMTDGPILHDDKSRMKVYNSLGFTQVDLQNEGELPWRKE